MNQLVFQKNNQIVTNSRELAREFNKNHRDVLGAIDRMLSNQSLNKNEVKETTYIHEQNKQEYRQYLLTDIAYKKISSFFSLSKKHEPSNYVYILKHKGFEGYYKIGITHDIQKRIKSYNTASPLGIEIVYIIEFDRADLIETKIHSELNEKRCNGEWFRLNKIELNAVISKLKNEVKNYESISV